MFSSVFWTWSEVCNNSCVKADLPLALAHWREIEIFCRWVLDQAQKVRCCKKCFLLFHKSEKGEEECQNTAVVLLLTAGSVLHCAWPVPSCNNATADFCQYPLFGCSIRDIYARTYSERFQVCRYFSMTRHLILLNNNHGLKESFMIHFGSFA